MRKSGMVVCGIHWPPGRVARILIVYNTPQKSPTPCGTATSLQLRIMAGVHQWQVLLGSPSRQSMEYGHGKPGKPVVIYVERLELTSIYSLNQVS